MKKQILLCSIAFLACMVLSCPSPVRSVTVKVRNDSASLSIKELIIAKKVGTSVELISDNLLAEAVGPESEAEVLVPMHRVADGTGFALNVTDGLDSNLESVFPSDLLEAGTVFIITITGDFNSYSISVLKE